jgi:membrane protein implicated in regulation of membrane protease activity
MSLLSLSPVLLWFLAGIIFFALELLLPGLVVFFFGLGAWGAALATFLLPIDLATQLLVFLVVSVLTLLLLRSVLKKIFMGRSIEVDAMERCLPDGATGEVIEDILPPANGKIKFAGSFWLATADEPLAKGTVVRIVEKNNLTVKVSPMDTKGGN